MPVLTSKEIRSCKQIACYKTIKKLIEFNNKLKSAVVSEASLIHAGYGEDKSKKKSVIGVRLLDYSKGTGINTRTVEANLSPYTVKYLAEIIKTWPKEFERTEEKIIAAAVGRDGRAPVTKFTIIRSERTNTGEIREYPWYIKIEMGTGVPEKTITGGTQCKACSYQMSKMAFINLDDFHMYQMLRTTEDFILNWERQTQERLRTELEKVLDETEEYEGDVN